MKKILLAGLILSITTLFIGCGKKSQSYNKFMEEGKLALATEEYDKAANLFNLAKDEMDGKDIEAEALINQIQLYNNLIELGEDLDSKSSGYILYLIEGCDTILDIDSDVSLIKDRVEILKSDYEILLDKSRQSEEYIENRIKDLVSLTEQGFYEDVHDVGNELYWGVKDYPVDYNNYQEILQDLLDVNYELKSKFCDKDVVLSIIDKGSIQWSNEFIEKVRSL